MALRPAGASPDVTARSAPSPADPRGRVDRAPRRADGWRALGDRPHTILLAIVLAGLALRLLHFAAITRTPFPDFPTVLTESDMHATWRWAETILAGDVLGRNTYHPYFAWMQAMAPLETWYRWWGGRAIFQHPPLYAYWTAALLGVSGRSLRFVLLVQLLVGALQPLVLYTLGRRLFDARVGLLAAGLAAFYGPFVFYQGVHLRDWLPPLLEPLGLVLLLRARASGRGPDWALAGATLGVALLAKETILLFLPVAVLWLVWELRGAGRSAPVAAAWLLAGFLVAIAPLAVRNTVVGAPPFALSNRAAEGFIVGNAPDASPVIPEFPPSLGRLVQGGDSRLRVVVPETLAPYAGHWAEFADRLALRARALADPLEIPNNEAFGYGLGISPPLRATLRYGLVLPLGLAGLVVTLARWRAHALLALYGLSTVGALMFSVILARYRLVLVPVLLLYGAAGVVGLFDGPRDRRGRRVAMWVGLVVALALFQHLVLPVRALHDSTFAAHAPSYAAAGRLYVAQGRFDRAMGEVERLRAAALEPAPNPDVLALASLLEGDLRSLWAWRLIEQGRQEEARAQMEPIARAYAGHATLGHTHYNLGALYLRLGDRTHAREAFTRFLALEPDGPRAASARRFLAGEAGGGR